MSEGSDRSGRRLQFQDLMQGRVRHILLVSNLYDSFILTEDGQLNAAILRQFLDLNLSQNPDVTRVSTGGAALEIADRRKFDLIVGSMHVGDMDVVELARRVREAGLDTPVILLAYNNRELTEFVRKRDVSPLDRIFLWQGDVRILLAIVKYVEDRMNVDHDTGRCGVPVILVVEDNIRFYSSFLPVIYAELMSHSHDLIQEGLNLSQKMLRTRAVPKVLLCSTYDEAWEYFTKYGPQVLGVLSDIEFPWGGKQHRRAGVELTSRMRKIRQDLPIIFQSSIPQNRELADSMGASFLLKGSPVLLHDLRRIFAEHFGFGDFVFKMPDETEVDRAKDLRSLIEKLRTVPAESLAYHGERNHFSNWLKARTEFALAAELFPRKVSEFETLEHLREDMVRSISKYRRERDKVVVADFARDTYDSFISVSRIGGGSLGGKARGLAFVNRLLNDSDLAERLPGVRIAVPSAVVLGTDVFEEFIEGNDLSGFVHGGSTDSEIEARMMAAPFPKQILQELEAYLSVTHYPLAVRSSGLLEDAPYQPSAGVYRTFMLPNNDPDLQTRVFQLVAAVKRVYASTFSRRAKGFLSKTHYRLEEEKMAAIIQRVVGRNHGTRFYPSFSGVARSFNFYPTAPAKAEDGVVAVALGMGKTVVDGGACMRFCPRYPRHLVAFSSVDGVLRNSQRQFYALDLTQAPGNVGEEGDELARLDLGIAEEDGTLAAIGSTYSPDNDVVYDGLSRPGVRLINFAPILKHGIFPLAEILDELMSLGSEGTGCPVEIEFAVDLTSSGDEPPEFGFLQMRPLSLSSESDVIEVGQVLSSQVICRSNSVLGNGKVTGVQDLIVVDIERYDRSRSAEVALHIARFNGLLQDQGRPYLLIGVGRWGSNDPFLGIPVTWNQISGARVIVEAGFRDMKVEPSQGTHFFQNLTSCNVGYFTVNPQAGEGFVDWEWLAEQPSASETELVRHLRLDAPIVVKMNGRKGEGVVLKPGAEETR